MKQKHVKQFNTLHEMEHWLNIEGAKCKILGFSCFNNLLNHEGHTYILIVEGELVLE